MPTARQARKRSPKACLSCRARKVRCDVAFTPKACTNCILDKKDCVVTRRRHQHRKPSADEAGLPPGLDADDHSVIETMDDPDTPASSEARPGVRPIIHFACYHFLRIANLSDMPPDDAGFLGPAGGQGTRVRTPRRQLRRGGGRSYTRSPAAGSPIGPSS